MLPYGRHWISEDDIRAVVDVLRGDWLTTGPMVERLERAIAGYVGSAEAVAVANGTAALHSAMFALAIAPGDEVIVPAMTFAATANCVVYQGGVPVFADVDPQGLLLDPAAVQARITSRTRAVIAVDYAGQPCDYRALRAITAPHGLALMADAAHALGAKDHGAAVGSLADLSTFSLHPVKPITAGEGGIVTTGDAQLAARMRRFRDHGIEREIFHGDGPWRYEMRELGYNYRLTDIQCALACSQLSRLDRWTARRQAIARSYDRALAEIPGLSPLAVRSGVICTWCGWSPTCWASTGGRCSRPSAAKGSAWACITCRSISTRFIAGVSRPAPVCARWPKRPTRISSPCRCFPR